GALGQVSQAIELDLDVVEFLAGIRRELLIDFGVHDRQARPRRRRDFGDANILSNAFFDLPSDELLDTHSALSWPWRDDGDLADRYVGVFALRHRSVCPETPSNYANQENP